MGRRRNDPLRPSRPIKPLVPSWTEYPAREVATGCRLSQARSDFSRPITVQFRPLIYVSASTTHLDEPPANMPQCDAKTPVKSLSIGTDLLFSTASGGVTAAGRVSRRA